jgi:dsDNA-binding SOS-regulon protein
VSDTGTIIPVADLDEAHTCLDIMIEKVAHAHDEMWHTADDVWLQVLNSVAPLTEEQQRQNLALLLTVALQRLAQCAPS